MQSTMELTKQTTQLIDLLRRKEPDEVMDNKAITLIDRLSNIELMEQISEDTEGMKNTALTTAIFHANYIIASTIINKLNGSELNGFIDKFNYETVLTYAIRRKKEVKKIRDKNKEVKIDKIDKIIKLLIKKGGIDLNIPDGTATSSNKSPLIAAIKNGEIEIVKLLIQQGAIVNNEVIEAKKNNLARLPQLNQINLLSTTNDLAPVTVGGKKITKRKKFKSKRKNYLKKRKTKRKKTRYNR